MLYTAYLMQCARRLRRTITAAHAVEKDRGLAGGGGGGGGGGGMVQREVLGPLASMVDQLVTHPPLVSVYAAFRPISPPRCSTQGRKRALKGRPSGCETACQDPRTSLALTRSGIRNGAIETRQRRRTRAVLTVAPSARVLGPTADGLTAGRVADVVAKVDSSGRTTCKGTKTCG